MKVLLDFDGTLCLDSCDRAPTTPPPRGAAKLIRGLKAVGHEIIVFSCRANSSMPGNYRARQAEREVRGYLEKFSIPFDSIITTKPHADVVIDERALPFDGDWVLLTAMLRAGQRLRLPRAGQRVR